MLRCASSFVIAAYTTVRLIPHDSRALPADFLRSRQNRHPSNSNSNLSDCCPRDTKLFRAIPPPPAGILKKYTNLFMVMNDFIAVGTVLALLSSERDQRRAASLGISGAARSGGEHPETFSGTEVYHHEYR